MDDDGILYGQHLEDLDGQVRVVVYQNAFHAFLNFLGESDNAADAFEEVVAFMGL